MWGEPRKGTEAYLVKQEADKKKKIAKDKGLDSLLVKTYHDTINSYPSWIKNKHNKRWVHPSVSMVREIGDKYSGDVEFKFKEKTYKITRGNHRIPEFNEGSWYDLTLYLENKRVFEVTEEVTSGDYSTYQIPIFVNAYVNDEWVDDFKSIVTHQEEVSKATEIEYAEDPKMTQKLKDDFGIVEISTQTPTNNSEDSVNIVSKPKKPLWKRWLFGIIIVYTLSVIFSQIFGL